MTGSSPAGENVKASSIRVESDEELICGLVAEKVTACLREGREPDIEGLVADHPEAATQIRQLVPALTVLHQLSHETEAIANARPPSEVDPSAVGRLGDYRIVREVGRGGMGVVYEAQQVSLGRKVAIKVLPFAAVLDNRQLQRFTNEAQAAARLHHTHIVPVFSVGCERGVHYYAMQYIEGHPLSRVIHELRQLSGLDPLDLTEGAGAVSETASSLVSGQYLPDKLRTFGGSSAAASLGADSATGPLGVAPTGQSTRNPEYLRSVANLGVQAAEALEHAHQQGIVHRDIKPSNLLLDTQGHLWITDFGLAHCQADTAQTLTMPGDLLGTVRYMSPEQSLAKRVVIDHRTDIYSLGVTLYELLTLEPAFTGDDRQELLRQIALEEPRPPRRLNDAVPADLQTIVLKATEKEPRDRYATAQELADDLERFLEDKPILARPPTLLDRAAKWCRRHRAAVVAAVALLVLSVIGLAASTVVVLREQTKAKYALAQAQISFQTAEWQREQAEKNFEVAEQQRRRAEANFRKARDAVDRMLTQAAEKLADVPHVQPVRRALLEDALEFYRGFLAERSDDPDVRSETGRAYRRVGEINELLGQQGRAEEAYGHAIAVFEKLVTEFSDEPDYRKELAKTCGVLGKSVLKAGGRWEETEGPLHRALSIWEELVAECPDQPEYRRYYGITLNDLGIALQHSRQPEQAERSYRQALAVWEKLANEFPNEPEYRSELARIHNNLGIFLENTGRKGEAAYRRAIELQEEVVAEFPTNPKYKDHLAFHLHNLGDVLRATGRFQESEMMYSRSLAMRKELTSEFPSVPRYWEGLVHIRKDQAEFLTDQKRLDEAEKAYREALAIREQMVADFPDTPGYRLALSEIRKLLGEFLLKTGRPQEAEAAYREALAVRKQLVADFPDNPEYRDALAFQCGSLGYHLLQHFGRRDEAERAYREALAIRKQLVADFPDEPTYRHRLAIAYRSVGAKFDQWPEQAYRRAIALQEKLVSEFPQNAAYRAYLATSYEMMGGLLRNTTDFKQTKESYLRAIELLEGLVEEVPDRPHYRIALADNYTRLGNSLLRAGRPEEAEQAYVEGLESYERLLTTFPGDDDYPRLRRFLDQSSVMGVRLLQAGRAHNQREWYRRAAARHASLPTSAHYALYRDRNACLNLGIVLFETGLYQEARQVFREDLAILEKLCADAPGEAAPYEKLGWLLVCCPDPKFRDPAQAAELARKVIQLEPEKGRHWQTLGKAHYGLGDWRAAVEAQEKYFELAGAKHADGLFYLAMAHWQLGNQDQARTWYGRALMEKSGSWQNGALYRLEIEAAKLLEIGEQETEEQDTGSD